MAHCYADPQVNPSIPYVCTWESNWRRGGYLALVILIVIAINIIGLFTILIIDLLHFLTGKLKWVERYNTCNSQSRPWQLPQRNCISWYIAVALSWSRTFHQCVQQTDPVNVTCSGEMQLDCHPDFFQISLCGVCTPRCTTTKYITCTLELQLGSIVLSD